MLNLIFEGAGLPVEPTPRSMSRLLILGGRAANSRLVPGAGVREARWGAARSSLPAPGLPVRQ